MPRIRPWAVVAFSWPTTAMTLMAMLMVTGPSSAMNRPSWAIAKKKANRPPTGFVGAGISKPLSTGGTGRSCPGTPELTTAVVSCETSDSL